MFIKKSINNLPEGFTLLELLVSISVIAIIVGLAVVSLTGSQASARDTKRKSDLNQYRTAFENMANKNNNFYKSYGTSDVDLTTTCSDLGLGGTCPDDPISLRSYYVKTNNTGGSYTSTAYVMYAQLEDVTTTSYWVVCSNGKVGVRTSIPGGTNVCDTW